MSFNYVSFNLKPKVRVFLTMTNLEDNNNFIPPQEFDLKDIIKKVTSSYFTTYHNDYTTHIDNKSNFTHSPCNDLNNYHNNCQFNNIKNYDLIYSNSKPKG